MLDYLGVPYVQSAGEAEAMCAFLNRNGVSSLVCFLLYLNHLLIYALQILTEEQFTNALA